MGLTLGSDQRGGGGYVASQVCQVFVRRRSEAITGIQPGRRRRRSRSEPTLSRFCQGIVETEQVRAMCGYVSVPDV